MKITKDNAREFAHNVMGPPEVEEFNLWAGTDYSSKEELLESESDERIAEFFDV